MPLQCLCSICVAANIMSSLYIPDAKQQGGPDFFINTFAKPVSWWENQHTIWGKIADDESMKIVEGTYELNAHGKGMKLLDEAIEFALELY